MDKKIPDNEKWIHTPEMKAKLTRADAWMRDTTPKETDLDELERQLDRKEKNDSIRQSQEVDGRKRQGV